MAYQDITLRCVSNGGLTMIVETRLLNKLKEFGLNSYEAKIWTALLSRGISSAGELSDISNVPRSRAYDVLESLEKKGFIIMKVGKPIKYVAVKPQEVLERVKQKLKEDADKQAKAIDDLKQDEILSELDLLYTQGVDVIEPMELSGALRDRTNFYNNLNAMINNAQESVTIMTSAAGLMRKTESLKRSIERASKRGVKIRVAAPFTKENKKAVDYFKTIGEIKNVEHVKARFCIIDGKQIAFSLLDDAKAIPAYDVGIWVNTEFFAQTLLKLFDSVWK